MRKAFPFLTSQWFTLLRHQLSIRSTILYLSFTPDLLTLTASGGDPSYVVIIDLSYENYVGGDCSSTMQTDLEALDFTTNPNANCDNLLGANPTLANTITAIITPSGSNVCILHVYYFLRHCNLNSFKHCSFGWTFILVVWKWIYRFRSQKSENVYSIILQLQTVINLA